jgi:hypothetical protein
MTRLVLLCAGAALPLLWGIAHLFPTASVVKGFGDISPDNRRIIAMEWIVEGVALIFIGAVVLAAALVDPAAPVARAVFGLSAFALLALAAVSLFTGFRVRFLPFKLCPVIFTAAAVLILAGTLLRT